MQFKFLVLSVFAGLALASVQDAVKNIPPCAVACYNDGAKSQNCPATDFKCVCGSSAVGGVGAKLAGCDACGVIERTKAAGALTELCAKFAAGPSETDVLAASKALASSIAQPTKNAAVVMQTPPQVVQGMLGAAAIAALVL